MRQATSIDDFVSDPIGAFVAGRSWAYFWPREELSGFFTWGRPTVDDFDGLATVLEQTRLPWCKPRASLIDVTALDGLSSDVFERVTSFIRRNYAVIGKSAAKIALVRSAGLGSAIAIGVFSILPVTRFSMFTDVERGLEWLGHSRDRPALLELQSLRADALGAAPVLQTIRAALDVEAGRSLAALAGALGLSERTLQRRLAEAGTNLRREAVLARVRSAEKLLIETDAPVTEIAVRVGCVSPQHLNTLFRSVHQETPTAWRARHRLPPAT